MNNQGNTPHEFILGDSDYQEMHEGGMADGGHAGMMENGVSVEPGETASLTWRFTESGEVLYGCHEPGRYEDDMVGTIEVGYVVFNPQARRAGRSGPQLCR